MICFLIFQFFEKIVIQKNLLNPAKDINFEKI